MLVVSDTSPIRALNHLNLLVLLQRLYGEILVPPEVVRELEHPAEGFAPVPVSKIGYFTIRAPRDVKRVAELQRQIDQAEAEAIVLAVETRADVLLIDEQAVRAVAAALGLKYIGVLGVLVKAKTQAMVPPVRPLIDRLRSELHFHVSENVCGALLQMAGE